MKSRTKIAMIPHRLWIVILMAIGLLVQCSPDDVLNPWDNDLPDLTDAIPWESLGSGRIVFQRIGPYPGAYEGVYVMDLDRKKSWALQFSLATAYHISPDGEKIVFSMYSGSNNAYDIYSVNIDGSHLQKLTGLIGQDRFPVWSAQGDRIHFWLEGSEPPALYTQSAVPRANDLRRIMNFLITEQQWIISPSGGVSVSSTGNIVYACNWNRTLDLAGLYLMDLEGNNLKRVVALPEDRDFESPVFSPDDQNIAYLSVAKDSLDGYQAMEIRLFNPADSSDIVLADLVAAGSKEWHVPSKWNNVYLTWSPDGSKLLFNLPEGDFTAHLYFIHADGSHLTQVTFADGVSDRFVSWGR